MIGFKGAIFIIISLFFTVRAPMQGYRDFRAALLSDKKVVKPPVPTIPAGGTITKIIRNVKKEPAQTTSHCVAEPKVRNLPHLLLEISFALLR